MAEHEDYKMPIAISGHMEHEVTCPKCSSKAIQTIHNSCVLLDAQGMLEIYFHIFCNTCWKESAFVLEVTPSKNLCTCSLCNKIWEGKERHGI